MIARPVLQIVKFSLVSLLAFNCTTFCFSQSNEYGFVVEGSGVGTGRTADKPQSKCWHHSGKWWTALTTQGEFSLFEYNGTGWNKARVLKESRVTFYADCLPSGEDVYILAFAARRSELHKLTYNGTTYEPAAGWETPVSVPPSGETATIARDVNGVLWIVTDESRQVVAYRSEDDGKSWLDPVVLQENIDSDDITLVTRLNDARTGVMWTDQQRGEFGLAIHNDGDPAGQWSKEYIQGEGAIADDHINAAVASDGTLYIAVKTEFDSDGMVQLGVYRRTPTGEWSDIHPITILSETETGTRPIVVVNEERGELYVFYTNWAETPNTIGVKTARTESLQFPEDTIRVMETSTDLNNVTSTRQTVSSSTGLVIIASPDSGQSIDYCYIRDFNTLSPSSGINSWKHLDTN